MRKFEFTERSENAQSINMLQLLNEMGEDGWEPCHVEKSQIGIELIITVFFKREKQEGVTP